MPLSFFRFGTWSCIIAFRGATTITLGKSQQFSFCIRNGSTWNITLLPNPVGSIQTTSLLSYKTRRVFSSFVFNVWIPIFPPLILENFHCHTFSQYNLPDYAQEPQPLIHGPWISQIHKREVKRFNTFLLEVYIGLAQGPNPPDPGSINFTILI